MAKQKKKTGFQVPRKTGLGRFGGGIVRVDRDATHEDLERELRDGPQTARTFERVIRRARSLQTSERDLSNREISRTVRRNAIMRSNRAKQVADEAASKLRMLKRKKK